MSKDPLQKQKNETIGHLIEEFQRHAEAENEVDDVEGEIKELNDQIKDLRVTLKDKRDAVEESKHRLMTLVGEMKALQDGRPRLPNITPTLESDSADPATTHAIVELTRFGLSEKQVEKLQQSALATEHSIKSIADFIKAMNADEWWHRKVKGWGESAIDKATTAVTEYREAFPIPDGDEREKKCLTCENTYPQKKKKCPSCGDTVFELIDSDSPADHGELRQMELPEGEDSDVPSDADGAESMEMPEHSEEEQLEPVGA